VVLPAACHGPLVSMNISFCSSGQVDTKRGEKPSPRSAPPLLTLLVLPVLSLPNPPDSVLSSISVYCKRQPIRYISNFILLPCPCGVCFLSVIRLIPNWGTYRCPPRDFVASPIRISHLSHSPARTLPDNRVRSYIPLPPPRLVLTQLFPPRLDTETRLTERERPRFS